MPMSTSSDIQLPIPISRVAHRYFIYDISHATYLRSAHRILGVLVGTLPQSPQQNVFSGLPVELMPEEARLMVEQKVCFVVDDQTSHREGFNALLKDGDRKAKWVNQMRLVGRQVSKGREDFAKAKTEKALEKMRPEVREAALRGLGKRREWSTEGSSHSETPEPQHLQDEHDPDEALFPAYEQASPPSLESFSKATIQGSSASVAHSLVASEEDGGSITHSVTPTTSYPAIALPQPTDNLELPPSTHSYPLYRYIHSEFPSQYFLTPGLRFGCQYTVYPGDPLRFHSHFLALGQDWDEEMDLLTLVGGGRLGTGVKKGFLLGGVEKGSAAGEDSFRTKEEQVRCFCIEWGGM